MKTIYNFALISLLILSANISYAQSSFSRKLDSLIRTSSSQPFNGAIAIGNGGKIKYLRSLGYTDLVKKTPTKKSSQFLIGSISKQVTAVLVLREVEAGRINLDQTIRHYLPNSVETWSDSVSIQQLLTHRSGISQWAKRLDSKPGTKFTYSNLNYSILGQVLEKTSGKSYIDLLNNLLKVCKMHQTTIPIGEERNSKIKRLAKGYEEAENGAIKEESKILSLLNLPVMGIPAAGIISTARDLSKWNYSLHNRKLLADNSYKLMTTIYANRSNGWGEVGYGFGIQIDNIDDIFELSHNGRIPGFVSTLIYYPETITSIVILQNIVRGSKNGNGPFYLHDQIRKIVRSELPNRKN